MPSSSRRTYRSSRSRARRSRAGTSRSGPAVASSGSPSSSAGRTPSSSSATRTSTWRWTGSSGPRSGPRALRLGDGDDPATDVGPLINEAGRARVESYVEIGRREGELVCGGRAATGPGLDAGVFFEPTIFAGVAPMARIAQEEIFGPVISVIPVADYE